MSRQMQWIIGSAFIILIIVGSFLFIKNPLSRTSLKTYFDYTQTELQELTKLNSELSTSENSLKHWDNIMFSLIKENKLGDAAAARVYAYIYTSQRDALYISYNIKKGFQGSIDKLTADLLCLFFQTYCNTKITTDAYSDTLASIVLAKVKARIQSDLAGTKAYSEKVGADLWQGTKPYYALDVGSWKPWLIQSVQEFNSPPPPPPNSPVWQEQLKLSKTAMANITPEQTKAVVAWAGNPGTITPPGRWLEIANDYMFSHHIPLTKILLVRSILAMGIADAAIVVFNVKYTYWVKRPFMLDSTIQTVMPTPNHPSYPAGHSTISGAAAAILDAYFPKHRDYWDSQAKEASDTRVWGGIHFSIDAVEGLSLGKKVGEAAMKSSASH